MCQLNDSTLASSQFQNRYSIFSTTSFVQNTSCALSQIKNKDTTQQLIDIINKKGKRGFNTSSARFSSEHRKQESPGPTTYSQTTIRNDQGFQTKSGFGIGKRQMHNQIKDGGRVPYYFISKEPQYSNHYLTRPKNMFQFKENTFRENKINSEDDGTPGPGHYIIKQKRTGLTYKNLFKSNISQTEPLERQTLPLIKQVTQQVKSEQTSFKKRKPKTETRQRYIESTEKYLKGLEYQQPNLLNEDLAFINKNTNAFIEKNIHLYSSYMNFNKTPAPNSYKVKLPPSAAVSGHKFAKSFGKTFF